MKKITCEGYLFCDSETEEPIADGIMFAIIDTPKLPEPHHENVISDCTGVICAMKNESRWGYQSLTGEEKEWIGNALIEQGYPRNEWIEAVFLEPKP